MPNSHIWITFMATWTFHEEDTKKRAEAKELIKNELTDYRDIVYENDHSFQTTFFFKTRYASSLEEKVKVLQKKLAQEKIVYELIVIRLDPLVAFSMNCAELRKWLLSVPMPGNNK